MAEATSEQQTMYLLWYHYRSCAGRTELDHLCLDHLSKVYHDGCVKQVYYSKIDWCKSNIFLRRYDHSHELCEIYIIEIERGTKSDFKFDNTITIPIRHMWDHMQSAYNLFSLFAILAFIGISGKRPTVEKCTVMMSTGNRLVYDTGDTTCLLRQPDFQLAVVFKLQ